MPKEDFRSWIPISAEKNFWLPVCDPFHPDFYGKRMSEWFDCLIGFGANLGDLSAALERTQLGLSSDRGIRELIVSSPKLTMPVGGPGQPQYLNAVFRLQTNRSAIQLHELLQNLEREAGRERNGRWQPRVLDLDLLLYGSETIDTRLLKVPHPRMSVRRFVLEPAVEIAGEMVHPVAALNLLQLLERLNRGPNQLVWVTGHNEISEKVIDGATRQLSLVGNNELNSSGTTESGRASWTIVAASDKDTFESLQSTAKIVVWSNPRPSGLQAIRFAGPQIELPKETGSADRKRNLESVECKVAELQSEILAAIEAASG
jgi:2-amino-4-hydroxy-6-hydroxymethyldihydropteridine diphosphokinase